MLKVTLSEVSGLLKVFQKIVPTPIVLNKERKKKKVPKPRKLFKGDHNLVAVDLRENK